MLMYPTHQNGMRELIGRVMVQRDEIVAKMKKTCGGTMSLGSCGTLFAWLRSHKSHNMQHMLRLTMYLLVCCSMLSYSV